MIIHPNAIGKSIVSSKSLMVTMAGAHRFQYSLMPDSISIRDCDSTSICYDCLYDLDIVISNDCSNPGNNPIIISRTNLSFSDTVDIRCDSNVVFPGVDTTMNLTVGTYSITKTLTISERGLSKYNEIFLQHNTCKTLQQFIQEQQQILLDSLECYPSCQSCSDNLGTWSDYRERYMVNNNIPPTDSASFREEAWMAYQEDKEACDELCSATGLHNSVREQMLADVTYPYGQFAIIDNPGDPNSIFHIDINGKPRFQDIALSTYYEDEYGRPDSIVLPDGTKQPPTFPAVTSEQFAQNFKDTWPETLLQLHPEYNKLLMYESFGASLLWDDRFQRIETFKQAVDSGFLNPFAIAQGTGAGQLPAASIFDPPVTGARDPFFTTSMGSAQTTVFKNALFNFVDTFSVVINIWSLATMMAHCDGDSLCILGFMPVSQVFALDTACSGELDFAWKYFRQMYLERKAALISDIIYNAYPLTLLQDGQTENFPHLNLTDGSVNLGITSAANGTDSILHYIDDNCHRYAAQWLIDLHPCNLDSTDSAIIIPKLIGVCKAGGDVSHVFGSGTTIPGTYYGVNDSSFIQVLKDYLGSRYDSTCNAFLITEPKPYDEQPPFNNIPVYTHPDSCQCEKISQFYQQYKASADSSFSAYITRITGTYVSEATLDSLRMLCNGEIACKFLSSPVILPPVLQCGIANRCIGCIAMDAAYQEFQESFPGVIPSYNNNDTVQQKRNILFEHFMNYKFGFAKTFVEYLEFMDSCQLKLVKQSTCDTLYNLLTNYQNNINNQHTPKYDAGGCDTSKIKAIIGDSIDSYPSTDLFSYMFNGVFKVPFGDTLNIYPEFYYADTLCIDSSITIETKLRCPRSDSGFQHYMNAIGDSTEYGEIGIIYRFSGGKKILIELTPVINDYVHASILIGEAPVGSTYNHSAFSTTINDLGEWITVKTILKNDKVKFYFNGVAVDSTTLLDAPSYFYNADISSVGPDLQVDWFKIYDRVPRLRYFEDFNGCDKMGQQTLSKNCEEGCAAGFLPYFNTQMGTHYHYDQLDSLYFTSCGYHPDPCYRNPIDCNNLKQVIVDYYNSKFHITHDSTGFEHTVWAMGPSYDTTRNFADYNFRDFIRNGIISTPDSVTYLPGDFIYGYKFPMCVGNEFSWETRVRIKPGFDPDNIQYQANFTFDNSGHIIIQFTGNTNVDGFQVSYIINGNDTVQYTDFSQTPMHGVTFSDWRVLKFTWKNNKLFVYVDGVLTGTAPFAGNFNTLRSFNEGSWNIGPMDIDYVKISDRNGIVQYTEDFLDYTNFTKVPLAFICPPVNCKTDFSSYFNTVFSTSYTYSQLTDLYKRQCGMDFESCGGGTGPQLCGDLAPVAGPMTIDPLSPCEDSTLFSQGVGTLLYNAYHDSLVNSFNDRYLQKCLQAGSHETFTVTAPISEFHYTLYYYDQAGNLVKTVPPAGINTSKIGDTAWNSSVKADRDNGTVLTPTHTLYSQYRYNTLNQVITDSTPDAAVHHFWYDRLGRLALSQNATQKISTELNSLYSYTFYDYLGRITEVGQIKNNDGAEPVTHLLTRSAADLTTWFSNRVQYRGQITQTFYDERYSGFFGVENSTIWQRNLRNRVSYTSITDTITNSFYTQATFYCYDIHGNVDTLLQDYGSTSGVRNVMNIQVTNANRWKRLVYQYDLISGKVNSVAYQPPRGSTYYPDMFYHRYTYDAENRLTLAETSMDSVIWEKEARYEYYRHGPLARVVTGEQLVQGTDYAYTLQGWLKGVNSTGLDTAQYDMGADGKYGSSNQYTARDAVGFNLNYFGADYVPINATVSPFSNPMTNLPINAYRPLYNGNISSMAVNIRFPGPTSVQVPQLYNYKYDQLNRITQMSAYRGYNISNNGWDTTGTTDYRERISYDANGNIIKYLRNGISGINTHMDSLTYNYYTGTNRLKYVKDSVPDNIYSVLNGDVDDINNQTNTSNYTYTAIGNLQKDLKDSITLIKWNVYGKITEIQRLPTSARPISNIQYYYDASGNRIGKRIIKSPTGTYEFTWYVRDAQGNIMATYFSSGPNTSTLTLTNYSISLTDQDIYGSSRIGVVNRNLNIKLAFTNPAITNFERGDKSYELSNHLGNVFATISDKKIPVLSGSTVIAYNADIITANDYYPFGMTQPGRKYQATSTSNYRYSINGQEKEKELNENITTALYWEYDSRIGRRWNIDPKPDVGISSYSTFGNNPIFSIDALGDTATPFKFDYLPVSGNTRGGNPIANGIENVFRFAYNNTIGAVAGLSAGVYNTATNQSSSANTNIMYEFDKFQKGAYDYHTTTPPIEQLKELGRVATDLRTYDIPAQLLIAHTASVSLAGFKQPGLSYTGSLLKVESAALTEASAYEKALAGGSHSGFLKNYLGKSVKQIQSGITSMKANIIEHQNLISDPAKYLEQYGKGNWNLLDPRQQQHLLNVKWPGDIQRANEQINVLEGILNNK